MGKKKSLFRSSFHEVFMYQQHKEALKKISSAVNVRPPLIKRDVYLNIRGLRSDKYALRRIIKDNIDLLERLNRIKRTHGISNSFNTKKPISQTRMVHFIRRIEDIETENQLLGCRLLNVKPKLTNRPAPDSSHSLRSLRGGTMSAPLIMIQRREELLRERLFHPKVYLDLELKDIRPLGRIIIQLHTRACPEMVLEFVRVCSKNHVQSINFIRIFPDLWIEGEIAVHNEYLSRPNFEHNINLIRHDTGTGIFSFAKCYTKTGFPSGLLNFSASFKPMPVLNGQRVAFGQLVAGHRVLDCLQDYGTKNGKVRKDVVAVHTGIKADYYDL